MAYSLTVVQENMWRAWKHAPRSHFYNIVIQCRIEGGVDVNKLRTAVAQVEYFDALRTYFTECAEGKAKQNIADYCKVDLRHIELKPQEEGRAKEILRELLQAPFDLTALPLARFTLISCSSELHYFSFVSHHILLDGKSSNALLNFITDTYNDGIAISKQRYNSQACYAEYIALDKKAIKDKEGVRYWQEKLYEAEPALSFSYRQYEAPKTNKGRRYQFSLPESSQDALKRLSRTAKTTPFIVLKTAFLILLSRYSQQKDITINYPINLRPKGFEKTFGLFINTLCLRHDFNESCTVSELLGRITEQRKKDRLYQLLPFTEILRAAKRTSRSIVSPNTLFGQTTFSTDVLRLEGTTFSYVEAEYAEVASDLALVYDPGPTPFRMMFEYNEELFDAADIEKMQGYYINLLHQMADNPESMVDSLSVFKASERDKALMQCRGHCHPAPQDQASTIPAMILHQAQETPEVVAIQHGDNTLTYRVVEERANQLAHYLKESGIGKRDCVAVLMQRSVDMVCSLLAIQKIGAAYVPIYEKQAVERIQSIINDCAPRALLAHNNIGDVVEELQHVTVINVDDEAVFLSRDKDVVNDAVSDDVAYIIYTSGSTGKPKGVRVTQHNAYTRLKWIHRYFKFSSDDVVLHNIHHSFDPSVYEIFGSLGAGGQLVLASEETCKDPTTLIQLIHRCCVTFMNFVPSMLQIFLEHVGQGDCSSLKHVISGGEALSANTKNLFYKTIGHATLYNMYGPTEATIVATCVALSPHDNGQITIGTPIDNTAVYILNRGLQLQPVGTIGELYVGGDGVAQGYVNNTDLTDSAFIPDPYNDVPGATLYKTGDLGRYLENGAIEFLGRTDNQVKIRGYRVELGEIESALEQVSHSSAVVIPYAHSGTTTLIAFIRRSSALTVSKEYVIDALKQRLPNYMIPGHVFFVEEIPLTSNGKTDQRTLQKRAEKFLREQSDRYIDSEALSPLHKELQHAWAKALGMSPESIGIHQSFFDELGGDSLSVVEAALLVQKMYNLTVSAEAIFQYPTIAKLSHYIQNEGRSVLPTERKEKQLQRMAALSKRRMVQETRLKERA